MIGIVIFVIIAFFCLIHTFRQRRRREETESASASSTGTNIHGSGTDMQHLSNQPFRRMEDDLENPPPASASGYRSSDRNVSAFYAYGANTSTHGGSVSGSGPRSGTVATPSYQSSARRNGGKHVSVDPTVPPGGIPSYAMVDESPQSLHYTNHNSHNKDDKGAVSPPSYYHSTHQPGPAAGCKFIIGISSIIVVLFPLVLLSSCNYLCNEGFIYTFIPTPSSPLSAFYSHYLLFLPSSIYHSIYLYIHSCLSSWSSICAYHCISYYQIR